MLVRRKGVYCKLVQREVRPTCQTGCLTSDEAPLRARLPVP